MEAGSCLGWSNYEVVYFCILGESGGMSAIPLPCTSRGKTLNVQDSGREGPLGFSPES